MELKAGYKQTEIGVIPDDWDVTTVGAEFHIQLGKMLDTEKNVGVPKPFLGNRSVQWGYFDLADIGQIRLTPADIQRFRLRKGDLLVCEGGEVGRAAIWNQAVDECYFQKALHRLRPKGGYNVALMVSLLQRLANTGALQNYVTQTSIAHLPKDKFETVPIPSIPLVEQKAIADALSDADALIESLDQLIAKKRQIKQGAMQELLTGKRRLPGFEGEWEAKRLADVGECLRGVTYKGDSDLWSHDTTHTTRLLRSNNVQNSTVVIDEIQFVNSNRVAPQQLLRPRDILICMANGSKALVGKAGLFNVVDGYEYTFGAFMGCFRTKTIASNPVFVFYLFQTARYREYINNLLAGSTINNLNPGSIESLEFHLPEMTEQTAIATVLSDMDTELAALESRLTKARQIKQGMMQELLTGRIRLL